MKERKGWKWNKTSSGGYWSKVTGDSHRHKKDFFCPHCKRPTGTVDDKYLNKYGICYLCFTMHVDEREKPNIDLSKYKK
jgi:hypothetical protein